MKVRIPREKIALRPCSPRHNSKLMVVFLPSLECKDILFKEITSYLSSGDAVAVNDSHCVNARLKGKRKTGGKTEFLLTEKNKALWKAIGKPAAKLKEGMKVEIASPSSEKTQITIVKKEKGGRFLLKAPGDILDYGYIPLPPYITSRRSVDDRDQKDYRSVFSRTPGSSASATASLHFSPELVKKIKNKGVKFAPVTLHVGPGTFLNRYKKPLPESYAVGKKSARIINSASRILVCGTTVMRTLESATDAGSLKAGEGTTELYIKRGYKFKNRGMFLTNFHLPSTPLIELVAAYMEEKMPGRGEAALEKIYRRAKEKGYRFLSYGDAMLMIDRCNEQ